MKTFNNNRTVLQPKIKKSGNANGLIQVVNTSGTAVYLFGSLNNSDFVLIETFNSDTIKEIQLCPFMKVAGSSDASTNATNNVVMLFEYNA
jgi:cobalamin biosynthesis Co2+ chelatase CbiK|tara:strand:- start:425 stop:697 length:273 start_codon:yes stop_codon:yes gene_type:complete